MSSATPHGETTKGGNNARSGRIRSVSKAVRILVRVADADDGVSAKDVAEGLGMPIATTYHLLNTLLAERMLSKDSRRRYHLGPMVGALTDAFQRRPGPPEWLLHPLRTLAADTGETAYLSGWMHDEATVLATVEGSHSVRVQGLHTGFAGSAHARASGKVFLAFSDPAQRGQYLARHSLEPLTPNTITDPVTLQAELARVADRGFALDLEEFTAGVRCVSAPVMSGRFAAHAYTVSVPSDRFDREREVLIAAVLRAAAAAEIESGEASA
jgi:IclR family transcriptional regulator, acetate operon repressor